MSKPRQPKKQKEFAFLDLKERTKLAALLEDPVMQKALGNISVLKPGAFFVGSGVGVNASKDAAMATLMASNRLHQIQGWEMFEAALFSQADDPKAAKEKLTETYPEGA